MTGATWLPLRGAGTLSFTCSGEKSLRMEKHRGTDMEQM